MAQMTGAAFQSRDPARSCRATAKRLSGLSRRGQPQAAQLHEQPATSLDDLEGVAAATPKLPRVGRSSRLRCDIASWSRFSDSLAAQTSWAATVPAQDPMVDPIARSVPQRAKSVGADSPIASMLTGRALLRSTVHRPTDPRGSSAQATRLRRKSTRTRMARQSSSLYSRIRCLMATSRVSTQS